MAQESVGKDAAFDHVAQGVLDSLVEGCQVVGPDWRYVYVNDAVAAQGQKTREELLGRTMMECYPGIETTAMFEALQRSMATRTHHRMENAFELPDGSVGWFELRFVPVPAGVCVLSMDITQEKRAQEALRRTEEQLRQAQKMEAVGRLAAGVAHDFNNLLSVILSYADLILWELEPHSPLRRDVEEIADTAKRAAGFTRQLLMFTKPRTAAPAPVQVGSIITGMENMLRRMLGRSVELVVRAGAGMPPVVADTSSLEQVLLNLVVNARDAMPDGGQVQVSTSLVVLDEAHMARHPKARLGPHVLLQVKDSGLGMDAATQAHVFEPFFSTKEKGKGTGLGLSTVMGIVEQAGGHVAVQSTPGMGCTFNVYLPCVERLADVAAPAPDVTAPAFQGSETILVVEDDQLVRLVASGILRRHGYNVLDAAGPKDALDLVANHPLPIHLVLTDVVMPHMSGRELGKRLTELRPDLRVVCMSGEPEAFEPQGLAGSGAAPFVQKPFTRATLSATIRQVLDAPAVVPH